MLRLAAYLAQPIKQSRAGTANLRADGLVPGDVLLMDGNTRGAALVRRVTGSAWSHVAMYVGPLEDGPDPRCVVEADVAAGVRAVRLSEFKGLNIRVLRPKGLDEPARRRVTEWVVSRIGHAYDLAHAWLLAMKLLRLPFASRRASGQSAARFICSTLLAQAYVLVGYAIAADHRYVTPGDFESAPVFDVVRPS